MCDTIYLKIIWNRLERARLAINEVLAALADDTRRLREVQLILQSYSAFFV